MRTMDWRTMDCRRDNGMGHLRNRNEAENGLAGKLGGLRERQKKSYGRNHPTV